MNISEFQEVLSTFSDDPSDISISQGKLVAQIRDELIDVTLSYSADVDRSLIVTENGLPQPATVWLLKRVAKLSILADRIISVTTVRSDIAARSPYIEPSGKLVGDLSVADYDDSECFVPSAVSTLLEKATNQLPGATSVVYLTSDAGEGKTTVINRVANTQAKQFKSGQSKSLIVPIPLSGRAFLTFDDAVIAALLNKLRFSYLYFDAFLHLVRMGVIVPAFDGYEEMLVEGSKGEAISALGNLVQMLASSGTIIVAARKAFFEYLSFRTQARLLDQIGDRSASFSRLALLRWTDTQFCTYGRLRNVKDPESIHAIVSARLGVDHPILTRAVLVRRLFDVIDGGTDRAELANLLGSNPHDYFFTFVDTIVAREASEKWLAHVTGEIREPLLAVEEHHALLAQIAQEMWQSSSTSIRHDVLDVIVELFAETAGKNAAAVRQIKERLKQHSLLAVDSARGQALAFDHEDFQRFYLGESIGRMLSRLAQSEISTCLSINLIPAATIEQAVQHLIRNETDAHQILNLLQSINETERSFSFCKENCAAFIIRLSEFVSHDARRMILEDMFFPIGALAGRTLKGIRFNICHFQPTSLDQSSLIDIEFDRCEFERLEIDASPVLSKCTFSECTVSALIVHPEEEHFFNPVVIAEKLVSAGATIPNTASAPIPDYVPPDGHAQVEPDQLVRMTERFLRAFLRRTHIDEDVIRLRMGKNFAPKFLSDVVPSLLQNRILEEVVWKGRGVKRRFKLAVAMSDVNSALEQSNGDFDRFLNALRR